MELGETGRYFLFWPLKARCLVLNLAQGVQVPVLQRLVRTPQVSRQVAVSCYFSVFSTLLSSESYSPSGAGEMIYKQCRQCCNMVQEISRMTVH